MGRYRPVGPWVPGLREFRPIEGLDELLYALKALPKELVSVNGGPVRKGLEAAAKMIRDSAKAKAPRRTGNLIARISMRRARPKELQGHAEGYFVFVKRGGDLDRHAPIGKRNAYYANFVEFGTSRMRARPFMRPAFDENKYLAVRKFREVLTSMVKDLSAKYVKGL